MSEILNTVSLDDIEAENGYIAAVREHTDAPSTRTDGIIRTLVTRE